MGARYLNVPCPAAKGPSLHRPALARWLLRPFHQEHSRPHANPRRAEVLRRNLWHGKLTQKRFLHQKASAGLGQINTKSPSYVEFDYHHDLAQQRFVEARPDPHTVRLESTVP